MPLTCWGRHGKVRAPPPRRVLRQPRARGLCLFSFVGLCWRRACYMRARGRADQVSPVAPALRLAKRAAKQARVAGGKNTSNASSKGHAANPLGAHAFNFAATTPALSPQALLAWTRRAVIDHADADPTARPGDAFLLSSFAAAHPSPHPPPRPGWAIVQAGPHTCVCLRVGVGVGVACVPCKIHQHATGNLGWRAPSAPALASRHPTGGGRSALTAARRSCAPPAQTYNARAPASGTHAVVMTEWPFGSRPNLFFGLRRPWGLAVHVLIAFAWIFRYTRRVCLPRCLPDR